MHQLIITQGKANIDRYLATLKARGHTYELIRDKAFAWKGGEPDWQKLGEYTSLLYSSRRETIDTIKWFLTDWQFTGKTVGKIVYSRLQYPIQLVKIRPKDDETADHEDMHLFDYLCRVYLNFELATLFGVSDFDTIVHGEDPRFKEYEYAEVWKIIASHVSKAVETRRLHAKLSFLQQVLVLYRRLQAMKKEEEEIAEAPALLGFPLDPQHMRVTQAFGVPNRRYPLTKHHVGIDIRAPLGSPIYAMTACRIIEVLFDHPTLGNACEFEFTLNGTFFTGRYLHMQVPPMIGAYKKGDFIGRVGNTGDSDGPHLHLDIVRGDFDLGEVNERNWREKFVDPTAIMERIPA